jgi:hypothetical protein
MPHPIAGPEFLRMTIWSPAMTARLGELWPNAKLSITTIALRLGREFDTVLTRNAVAGKAHRDGLAAQYPRTVPEALQPGFVPKQKPRRTAQVIKPKVYLPKATPIPSRVPVVIDTTMPLPVALSESDRCRWLLGDVLKGNRKPPIETDQIYARWADVPRCTNQRDGEHSYCKLHRAMASQGAPIPNDRSPVLTDPLFAPKPIEEMAG